jgi:uncharacterized membrane protein YidH (DUF202 family)
MESADDPQLMETPRDPGLQAERTALAWSRTGLAVFVNAVLALRSGWASGETSITVLGLALLVAAAAAALCGGWRRRHLLSGHPMIAPPAIVIAGAAGVTWLACAAAIASVAAAR